MCWYIVETIHGSVAVDGEMSAHAYYHACKGAGQYAARPRAANSTDLVDRAAVIKSEEQIATRRREREYANRIGLFNAI